MTAAITSRLERLPGGFCTHWENADLHGARQERTFMGTLPATA